MKTCFVVTFTFIFNLAQIAKADEKAFIYDNSSSPEYIQRSSHEGLITFELCEKADNGSVQCQTLGRPLTQNDMSYLVTSLRAEIIIRSAENAAVSVGIAATGLYGTFLFFELTGLETVLGFIPVGIGANVGYKIFHIDELYKRINPAVSYRIHGALSQKAKFFQINMPIKELSEKIATLTQTSK